jgi:hypothetical protein
VSAMALAFAIMGAAGYGVASVLQAIGARRGRGMMRTLRDPFYLCGLGLDLLAWLASLVALRTLPVYQVQAVLAGSLAVTVVVARIVLAARLRAVDLAAVAVTVVALAALAVSSGPQDPVTVAGATRFGLVTAAVAMALAGWAVARRGSPNAAGALAGLAFGGAALCARAVTLPANAQPNATSLATIAADPLAWALAGYGATGILLYANALERGQVGPATALLWIVEVIAPSSIGVVLLGDTVRAGWTLIAATAVIATVAAAAVLANAPAYAAVAPTATCRDQEPPA